MTAKVTEALENIKSLEIFNDSHLHFIGGTALAYYLNHRISEDIDIISTEPLPYKTIIPVITGMGGHKLRDENIVALRLAGLFPDEYMLKFNFHGVKLEFFRASMPLQKQIIRNAITSKYLDANLNILDIKSIAKLKLIALLSRNKSRDLYDFKVILEKNVLTEQEILDILIEAKPNLKTLKELHSFIETLEIPNDDETVYLNEKNPINLTFEEIKVDTLTMIKNF